MKTGGSLVFIQGRTHKAGAQTCLARLLAHEKMQRYNPVLVASGTGWLTGECDRLGIRHIEVGFPSSRSLLSRMLGNSRFASDVKGRLGSMGIRPSIIHANDHLEGLLAIGLARETGSKSALFLRSSWMTRRDYFKYGCDRFDVVAAVGERLQERARAWDGGRDVLLIHDGLYPNEFRPAKEKPAAFPGKLLVIGSPVPGKGWSDLYEALKLLAMEGSLLPLTLDFTGERPDKAWNGKPVDAMGKVKFSFLGRVDDLPGLVRDYDLVINPSRNESFGIAAVETLAAGVPLLSSRSGIIEQVLDLPHMLFRPHDHTDLARALKGLIVNWDSLDTDITRCQGSILRKFDINRSADKLAGEYERLLHG